MRHRLPDHRDDRALIFHGQSVQQPVPKARKMTCSPACGFPRSRAIDGVDSSANVHLKCSRALMYSEDSFRIEFGRDAHEQRRDAHL